MSSSRINLLIHAQGSKWTAVDPVEKEKHFILLERVKTHSLDENVFRIRSILTGRERLVAGSEFKDSTKWKRGWH